MNIIHNLFNEKYVIQLFKDKALPLYPDFANIKKIKIKAHKNHIWEFTYHVVIEFTTYFTTKENKTKILPIFCSAHSNEPRENVYAALKYLWNNGFSNGFLTVPRPLFYSDYFQAIFYRGVNGRNLYHYIREKNYKEIEIIVPKAAAWFAKLHKLPAKNAYNFSEENSRIKTVVPGVDYILHKIKTNYPDYYETYKKMYDVFISKEEGFLASTDKRWLTHGDAHGENIIKIGRKKLAIIDFTDMCLSDFARDIGCFLQQLEYMLNRKIGEEQYTQKIKAIFLESYLTHAKIDLDASLQKRIDNYYNWTAIRTATFFLSKEKPEPKRAEALINHVAHNIFNH